MPNQNNARLLTELRRHQRKQPKTATMELLVPDMLGILKCKRIRRNNFEKACGDGLPFCAGATMLTALGGTVPGHAFTEHDGDPDLPGTLIPGSIAPVPWATRPMLQALFRLHHDDGTPFYGDPRTVLENAMRPFRRNGIRIVMAAELEFYLLDASAAEPTANAPPVPGMGRPQPGPQVYHPDDLWDVQPFLDDVYDYCDKLEHSGGLGDFGIRAGPVRNQSASRR